MNDMTDDQLAEGFANGDLDFFEQLVYRYKNGLYQYIMALVKDEGAAGDLFQEVFLNLFKQKGKYKAEGKFKAWLFRCARNRVLNFFRDKDKLYSLDLMGEDEPLSLEDRLADKSPLPLAQLETQELGRQLAAAALRLPERQREIVYLRQYMTFQEIADLLGRPIGTILSDFNRAVKKMQHILYTQEGLL